MDKEKLKILEEIYNKPASECSKEEIEISILIPIFYIFDDSDADIINYNGTGLERKSFMKKFEQILKKINQARGRNDNTIHKTN